MESMEMQKRIYSVAQINYYLKEMLREDDFLNGLWIKGEISGYKEHSSGHIYFSLKDGQNSLRCVIFRSYTGNIQFAPQSGMEVLAYGTVSLYERDGNCQLYVEEMIPAGAGAYFLALENLKKALREEGLFSEQRKKPLPYFCHVLGVVTSQEGAAWADIQRVAYSRFPAVEIRLFPTLVQGEKAPQSIVQALAKADASCCDIIIVGRGGGSYEDLAAFDTEIVVRAIAACQTPVISAVGHESDFSLADLAADLRATTPSHGAQLAVREKRELLSVLDNLQERLGQLMAWNLKSKRDYLESLAQKTPFLRPQSLLESAERSWQGLFDSLYNKKEVLLNEKENQISVLAARLHLLSPLATLARGYAICSKDDGQIVKSTEDLSLGENISLRLAQGIAQCSVEKLQDNHQ